MQGTFSVTVAKDYLQFSAAHFITMKGHQCESLHGHNYRVGIRVDGDLEPEPLWVVDFSLLKEIARPLVKAVDHKVLLPSSSDKMGLRVDGERVSVSVFGESRYVFPLRDCAILPIENSTAEVLARYLAEQVRAALAERGASHLTALELEVEESPGQTAVYRVNLPAGGKP
ncbi:MAG TPA: 6-pyruvoyl tetrahydropterin synthase family protein [Gemmatimonadales bacterium]|nr:6-pyruvoyl tetrahydropterin synthase family protein [Gemmatimonadales bacterium]